MAEQDDPIRFRWALLAPRHWPAWLTLALLLALGLLPRLLLRGLALVLGWFGYYLGHKPRRIARLNLRHCFPSWSERARRRLLRRHFRIGAQCLLDIGLLWVSGGQGLVRRIEVHGAERLTAALAHGQPVILLVPHTLALEQGALALTKLAPGVGLVSPLHHPLAEWLNRRMRTRYGARLFTRDRGLRPIVRALRNGAFFYYLPDQDRRDSRSVFVPFFAETKATLPTLGRLARLVGACVIPTVCRYDPRRDRYQVQLHAPLTDFPSLDAARDVARMNREIEALLAPDLAQYMWSLRLFRSRPPGVAPLPYPCRRRRRRRR